MTDVLAAALQAHNLGLCVVPPMEDGTKQPIVSWKKYQAERPSDGLVHRWYEREHRRGLGLVCGAVSGNLEMLEFEGTAVHAGLHLRYRELAEQCGASELLTRVLGGYTERTPGGGFHCLYRCSTPVAGNLKLARRAATAEELAANPDDKIKVLIETRGEGGYVITAPSNGGVHPSGGAWVLTSGSFAAMAVISADEREVLLALARPFDQMPKAESRIERSGPITPNAGEAERPGDQFSQQTSWAQILEPHGWKRLFTTKDGNQHWRRPGKKIGTSATISQGGEGVLYVFSDSTLFAMDTSYSKFGAYALLEHDGNHKVAARALVQRGFGAPPSAQPAEVIESVPPRVRWPSPPSRDVYHGLTGHIVDLITPYVESDPAAVLVQFLCAFGVAVGIRPHFMVGATRHGPNTYVALAGQTSRARKGTSWDPLEILFKQADPWFAQRIMSGIGSGERLVGIVADSADSDAQPDRRLLLHEPELARLLAVVNREGSTLSAYLRAAYDGKQLRNEVKEKRTVASVHHIGLIGHCTEEELQGRLSEEQIRNGLANRIAWFSVKRVKRLPDPPIFEGAAVEAASGELQAMLSRAAGIHRLQRSPQATRLWTEWYSELADDDLGMAGAIMARAEAHVTRFACIYALLDAVEVIELEHLRAAIALVEYSKRCISYVWGRETGDVIADKILEELAFGPLTRTQISREVFSGNLPAYQLEKAARALERRGQLVRERVVTSQPGRPAERWRTK